MDKDLITVSATHTAVGGVAMSGKQNINVNNQNGGTVNFNIKMKNENSHDNAEKMIAVQSFSKEYYQLLVTQDESIFQDNTVFIRADVALLSENVPTEIYKKCSSLNDEGKAFLTKIPAIICMKNTSSPSVKGLENWALYCYVTHITKIGGNIKINFVPLDIIHKSRFCHDGVAGYFDLNMDCAITDLHRSGWSARKVNLFDAFKVAGIDNVPVPQ